MGFAIPREILAIVEAQMDALEAIQPRHRERLLALAREVQAELEARLKALAPDKFTTQQTRVLLAQARVFVELLGVEFGERIGDALIGLGEVAARIGRDGLIDQVDEWSKRFPVQAVERTRLAAELLDEGLLEYYETSKQTYGMEAIAKMRAALVKGAMAGETVAQTWEKMAPAIGIEDWRAERIVRTEASFAMHRRQILDLIDTFGDEAEEWGKTLVAVHDDRTGKDSLFVDGQVRKLMEEFEDNEGRRYQHPPNRPNDREVMVPVPRHDMGARDEPIDSHPRSMQEGAVYASSGARIGREATAEQREWALETAERLGFDASFSEANHAVLDREDCNASIVRLHDPRRRLAIWWRADATELEIVEELIHAAQVRLHGKVPEPFDRLVDEMLAQALMPGVAGAMGISVSKVDANAIRERYEKHRNAVLTVTRQRGLPDSYVDDLVRLAGLGDVLRTLQVLR